MASNPTANLTSLLASSTIDDHDEILKAVNAVLRSPQKNQDAQHTRVVALLKLDRFDDALRALDDGGDELTQRCALEKAYALYKTGKLDDSRQVISASANTGVRGLRHVAAQVAYRAEDFEDAARIYADLDANGPAIEGEENDLRINEAAVDAQLEWHVKGAPVTRSRKQPTREDLEAFETSYNAACRSIARGDLQAGLVLLKRARELCEALDELSDEDKRAEVLPIMVQQAYVLTKLGRLDEARVLQEMINVEDIPEPPTRTIAKNNAFAAAAHSQNPYLTQRLFESLPPLSKNDRLFDHQASIMQRNRHIANLKCLKYDGVTRSTASILSRNASPTISFFVNALSAVNAAGYSHCESSKADLKAILLLSEKRPTDVGLMLTIIQLYNLSNNLESAIVFLETFFKRLNESDSVSDRDVRFAPGLVGLAVSLYRLQGRKSAIRDELGKAASYWRRKSKPSNTLFRAAGIELLESYNPQDLDMAGEIFASLRMQDPHDRLATAGYVASKATTDFSAVQSDLEKLTPIGNLVMDIDAEALEATGIASLPVPPKEASGKRSAPVETGKAAKKARKAKLPKDYEEGRKVDPERWLPFKDRSNYRSKGKKGKKKMMDSTQGGMVMEEESLELVGGVGAVKVEKALGGGAKAGKKKKGKK
ncbi:MAG: Signal recognition particle core component [Claussenomyces sp. TS43310]|nr:MAG: Signal recognition particle core component [Claussenomyces sp. TS43310]